VIVDPSGLVTNQATPELTPPSTPDPTSTPTPAPSEDAAAGGGCFISAAAFGSFMN
jgi:hypothetical protein